MAKPGIVTWIVLLCVTLVILWRRMSVPLDTTGNSSISANDTVLPPAHLHILIPATRPDANLCKALLSATVLGYPSPVIINWKREFNDVSLVAGGSHIGKISGIHDYISALDTSRDDDLVLVIDGYDVWLQLRPQTLLDRYYRLNHAADARIRSELGPAATGIRQEIVFGCQKRCWPWTPEDPPCYAVPNSTLPEDVYGLQTDTLAADDNPFVNYRPRFLNSGAAIGSVKAMRKLFDQALVLARDEPNKGSDQYIFSHIFGDQELWREAVKRDSLLGSNHSHSDVEQMLPETSFFNQQHISDVRMKAAERKDGNFEFGIGVDYGAEIVLNTVFAEEDTAWLTFSNQSQVAQARLKHGLRGTGGGVDFLPEDVTSVVPPFWTTSAEERLPKFQSWRDVPLLTDVYTGNTPAMIHHNAHRGGLKSRRESWWPFVWFHGHARRLLSDYVRSPNAAFAMSGYDSHSTREWWPYEIWKGGARNGLSQPGPDDDHWLRFDEMCRDHHEELFRDGGGPWKLPPARYVRQK